jgi:hypothetical protein
MICGVSERSARRKLRKIRKQFDKLPNQYVTVEEFCYYTGIPIERVYEHFKLIGEKRYGKEG